MKTPKTDKKSCHTPGHWEVDTDGTGSVSARTMGRLCRIVRVRFAGDPNHDRMVGQTGIVIKTIKSRNVVRLAMLGNGQTWDANPENLEYA